MQGVAAASVRTRNRYMKHALQPSRLGTSAHPTRNTARVPETAAPEDRAFISQVVEELLHGNLVLPADWHGLPEAQRDWVLSAADQNELIDRLAQRGLLTEYQASRVKAGT